MQNDDAISLTRHRCIMTEGDRGKLRAPAASRHRAGGASPLSRFASQPKALVTWRTLHDWLGPILTLGILLIFIFGIGRHWHG
jgi:hypothetical protein